MDDTTAGMFPDEPALPGMAPRPPAPAGLPYRVLPESTALAPSTT
jgi:hypothetical protein